MYAGTRYYYIGEDYFDQVPCDPSSSGLLTYWDSCYDLAFDKSNPSILPKSRSANCSHLLCAVVNHLIQFLLFMINKST